MLEKNPETVKIVFKHLPLRMHKQAAPAALAAIAAQNQGKFWQMHDALFAISNKLNKASIKKAATDIGLDMEQFSKDIVSQASKTKLGKDMKGAGKAGINGTPALFINGRVVKKRDIASIQQMVDQEMAKVKATPQP
ncbi:MAG: thioredoxin domain-containing protein, partial [Desulfobulbaceae bacterium]|nr:thioredoxin domain-containing protein [Desulfobulbaceae bacterium]